MKNYQITDDEMKYFKQATNWNILVVLLQHTVRTLFGTKRATRCLLRYNQQLANDEGSNINKVKCSSNRLWSDSSLERFLHWRITRFLSFDWSPWFGQLTPHQHHETLVTKRLAVKLATDRWSHWRIDHFLFYDRSSRPGHLTGTLLPCEHCDVTDYFTAGN